VSRYELVSFSTTPYAEVQRRVRRQHQVLGVSAVAVAGALMSFVRARKRR
jgi:kynurenine 3-monooxygenase